MGFYGFLYRVPGVVYRVNGVFRAHRLRRVCRFCLCLSGLLGPRGV